MESFKGALDSSNLFKMLYEKGKGMTFDHEGVPLVYSQQEASHCMQQLRFSIPKLPKFNIKTSILRDEEMNKD